MFNTHIAIWLFIAFCSVTSGGRWHWNILCETRAVVPNPPSDYLKITYGFDRPFNDFSASCLTFINCVYTWISCPCLVMQCSIIMWNHWTHFWSPADCPIVQEFKATVLLWKMVVIIICYAVDVKDEGK
jgi:hypothetical protein